MLTLKKQYCYTVQVTSNYLQPIGMRVKLFSHIPNISTLILNLSPNLRDLCNEKEVDSESKKPCCY